MRSEWRKVKLKNVLKEKNGYIRGPFGSALKRAELLEEGPIPVYEQMHAIDEVRSFRYYVGNEKYGSLERFTVQPNDLIVSCSGTVGRVSKITDEDPSGIISQALLILRVEKEKILSDYLKYFILSPKGQHAITSRSSGSVQVNIARRNIIEGIQFLLPPLPTQKAIADTLSCLDAKIEVNNKINENLEAQAQAIFKSWFVDFEPFQDGEFVESELGMIPRGWEIKKLKDTINVKYGKDHKALEDGNIPVYGSGGVMRYVDKSLYEEETVLIPRKGTLNNVMLINHPFWSVDTMFYTEIKTANFAKYLFHFLSRKDLASMNVGSAVPSMTVALLNDMKFIMPKKKTLEEFEQIASVLYSAIQSNEKQNTTLAALRDTLLPKLMSGEIEVPIDKSETD